MKEISYLVLWLAAASLAPAQEPPQESPREGTEGRVQWRQLRAALSARLAAIRAQAETGELSGEEARWQLKMALAEYRQSRAALLSGEERAQLARAYEGEGEREPGLPLSPPQQEEVRLLLRRQQREWQALFEGGARPTRARAEALRQAQRLAFEELLSAAQQAQLQAMKRARRRRYGLEAPVEPSLMEPDGAGD